MRKNAAFGKLLKKELEEFSTYVQSPRRIFFSNFLAGTARGLGFLLGAAIVITISSFILKSILANIPVVGDFFLALETWISETLSASPR